MRYASVCSGIGAPEYAWQQLGWECAFASEINPFARAVYAHRFPDVPLHGDFTKLEVEHGSTELLVAGTPCQDFSVAGLRAGLAGDRGGITVAFLDFLERLRPRWLVWENVPGVLSADDGRAFGIFLGRLAELGYGFAYRILDAQYFGVPQRRRRVFVVAHSGGAWQRAAAVLFERESLSGDTAPSREAGPSITALTANGLGGGGPDDNNAQGNHLIPTLQSNAWRQWVDSPMVPVAPLIFDENQVTCPHNRSNPQPGNPCHTLPSDAVPPLIAFDSKNDGRDVTEELAPTMRRLEHHSSHANAGWHLAVAFQESQSGFREDETLATLDANYGSRRHNGVAIRTGGDFGDPRVILDDKAFLAANPMSDRQMAVHDGAPKSMVRRLTPIECALWASPITLRWSPTVANRLPTARAIGR